MTPTRTLHGLLWLVALSLVGFALAYLPSQIAAQADMVSHWGRGWLIAYLCIVGAGCVVFLSGTVAIGVTLWRRGKRKAERRQRRNRNPSELTVAEREHEIEENVAMVRELQSETAVSPDVARELAPQVERFDDKRRACTLEIVAFGTISSGKSSVLNALAGRDVFRAEVRGGTTVQRSEVPWPGDDHVLLVDTPGLGEVHGEEHVQLAAEAARDADLVLLVIDGPLRESEVELLRRLVAMEKRLVVCLNKQDWYEQANRDLLLDQIRQQLQGVVRHEDIVAVQSRPAHRMRVRVLADGTTAEEPVDAPADIAPLARRMLAIVQRDGREMLLANLLLQSRGLVEEARNRVREALDRRALDVIDRHMWGAGGAAAVSPLPVLDLVAGGAVTTRMVIELARVYKQDVDWDAATRLMGQLAKNFLAILGVSAATPAVTSVVASLLKTVPGAGTIAGGALQGLVQALVTRWIGRVFMQYFRDEMRQPEGGLAGLARREWQQVTRAEQLRQLVQMAYHRLRTKDDA